MTVQVREASAQADPAAWLSQLSERMSAGDRALLARALALALERYMDALSPHGEPMLNHCREVTGILAGLRLDAETLAAGLLSGLPALSQPWEEKVRNAKGGTDGIEIRIVSDFPAGIVPPLGATRQACPHCANAASTTTLHASEPVPRL